jgi:hypothetical protein
MKKLIGVILVIVISSCVSNKNEGNSLLVTGGVLSAFVIAGALAPVAAPFSYVSYKNDKEKSDKIHEHFDPIYKERMSILNTKNPEAEAQYFYNKGLIVYYPTTIDGQIYFGIYEGDKFCKMSMENHQNNIKVILENSETKYLWDLMDVDPEHSKVKSQEVGYYKTFWDFKNIGNTYRKSFNKEMNALTKIGCI